MLDGSTMVTIPGLSPLQTTVISTADCSRHVVCQPPGLGRPELQIHTAQTTIARIPMHGAAKSKMRGRTEDPCQLAPLKKRKIQVRSSHYFALAKCTLVFHYYYTLIYRKRWYFMYFLPCPYTA
jgi:hypothetical protein